MSEINDVVIVGGGLVGSTLARALCAPAAGKQPAPRLALVEGRDLLTHPGTDRPDVRVSAITLASRRILEALDVWTAIDTGRIHPFREMRVWDDHGGGRLHFDSADIGEPELGYIVENDAMLRVLHQQLANMAPLVIKTHARPVALQRHADHVELQLDNGEALATRLLVGADGADSGIRELAGIHKHGRAYDQHALVATVSFTGDHRETAWQVFLPTGPLAFLPLAAGRCSIVWSTTPEEAARLAALEEAVFLEELQGAFGAQLGHLQGCGPRAVFPLRLQRAAQYVQPRVALIGDAAHTVHPLAGQGVNLGFADAAVLAEVLLSARQTGRDVGSLRVLRRYERWRKGDNLLMMYSLDGLKRLFASRLGPVQRMRNAGMSLTNAMPPVKHLFMRYAMGLQGDLPRLARGESLANLNDNDYH
jgi:2-octaprenylphenol hydroxylase